MKNTTGMIRMLIAVGLMFVAVGAMAQESELGELLGGEHKILRIGKSSTNQNSRIYVMWEKCPKSDKYITSSFPVEKIQFRFYEGEKQPFIKFRWTGSSLGVKEIQWHMDNNVIYVLITCQREYAEKKMFGLFEEDPIIMPEYKVNLEKE